MDSSPVAYRTVTRARRTRGDARRDLEEQRGLADPGLAAEQDDGARDEPAAEHPVQLADANRPADLVRGLTRVAQRHRATRAGAGRPPHAGPRLVADDGLDEGVPLTAGAALALPAEDRGAARLADVAALGAGHGCASATPDQASTGVFAASVAVIDRPLPSGSRSTTIASPVLYRPSSRCSASGSSIRFWIVRRSGRAP